MDFLLEINYGGLKSQHKSVFQWHQDGFELLMACERGVHALVSVQEHAGIHRNPRSVLSTA